MTKKGANLKKYMIKLQKLCPKIRSKCSWYQYVEYGEKSTKFFYVLGRKNAICGIIKTLINDRKEITMLNEINLTLISFYENLFQKKDVKKSVSDIETFLSQIQLPTISDENYARCDTDIIPKTISL